MAWMSDENLQTDLSACAAQADAPDDFPARVIG